jgi:hypothetical protein
VKSYAEQTVVLKAVLVANCTAMLVKTAECVEIAFERAAGTVGRESPQT